MPALYNSPARTVAEACIDMLRSHHSSPGQTTDEEIFQRARQMFFDPDPVRGYIIDYLNKPALFHALLDNARAAEMILARHVVYGPSKPMDAYSFANSFRESMDKPRYFDSWCKEIALTQELNDAMIAHIESHPALFRTAHALQTLTHAYFTDLAFHLNILLSDIGMSILADRIGDEAMKIHEVQQRVLIEELLPFFAMAHRERETSPEKICRAGLQKAYTAHAFTVLNEGGFKSCPFKTGMAHLLAADIVKNDSGQWALSPEPRPGALFAFLWHRLAPVAGIAAAPAVLEAV